MGKTPEEIKKLLANHKGCIYDGDALMADALAYIQQLEQINADFVERTAQLEAKNSDWVAKCHVLEERAGKDTSVPRWISADERLPKFIAEGYNSKITETVLAKDSTGFNYVGYFRVYNYDGSRAFYGVDIDGLEADSYSVTHWMTWPEPPKEG